MRLLFISYMIILTSIVSAQVKELSFKSYLNIVRGNHPVMVKAEQVRLSGEAQLLSAKGTLDPTLKGNMTQKEYSSKKYYTLIDAGLTVPTWVGLDVVAGYTQNYGVFLNDMDYTPSNGLMYAGVKLPVGQGLFFDKRRAMIQKAKGYKEIADAESLKLESILLYNAAVDYWTWYENYKKKEFLDSIVNVANQRLVNVRTSAMVGDKSLSDTLEPFIQLQNYLLYYNEILNKEFKSRGLVSTHLWADGLIPLEIGDSTIPQRNIPPVKMSEMENLRGSTFGVNHPNILKLSSKENILNAELKWSKELMKPKLDLKYNFLHEPTSQNLVGFNPNDYKFGLDVGIPLFLRNGRGEVNKLRADIEIVRSEQVYEIQSIQVQFNNAVNDLQIVLNQKQLFESNVNNYAQLVNVEKALYENGESSIMLINYREMAYLSAVLKMIENESAVKQKQYKVYYSMGIVNW